MMKKTGEPADYRRRDVLTASLRAVAYSAVLGGVLPTLARAADGGASAAAGASGTVGADAGSMAGNAAQRFFAVSSLLTGKSDLNSLTGQRTWQALQRVDSTFATRFAALEKALHDAALTDMASFDQSPVAQDAGLRATAVEIVSAWYLGHVGKGPDAVLLAYHDALMYRPTARLTTVPSYELGGFGYWAKTPA